MTLKDDVFFNPPPDFSDGEILTFVAEQYTEPTSVKSFAGERDQNFLIIFANKPNFFLKVSNQAESWDDLEVQEAALAHLRVQQPGIPVPDSVLNRSGHAISVLERATHGACLARAMSAIDGIVLAKVSKSPAVLKNLGSTLGLISKGLQGFFDVRLLKPTFLWNLDSYRIAYNWVSSVSDDKLRRALKQFIEGYEERVHERENLRWSTLYQDANDHNILVSQTNKDEICGIIDFGDMLYGHTVNDIAIAMAYAAINDEAPINTMCHLLEGYVKQFPLMHNEVRVLFDQVRLRLVQSICISAYRQSLFPENQYLSISRCPAEALFKKLMTEDSTLVTTLFCAVALPVAMKMKTLDRQLPAIFGTSGIRLLRPVEPQTSTDQEVSPERELSTNIVVHSYSRPIVINKLANRGAGGRKSLDIEFSSAAPHMLQAPFDSLVERIQLHSHGAVLVLRQERDNSAPLFAVIRNLQLGELVEGQRLAVGDPLGHMSACKSIGHSASVQLLVQASNYTRLPPTDVDEEEFEVWSRVCPDPAEVLGLSKELFSSAKLGHGHLMDRRRLLAPSLSVSYKSPLKIVRGVGPYLIGHDGRYYLDMVNNVAQVGHCHPHVVRSIQKQVEILNTNTRYLHDSILEYAERLTTTLPDPLNVCIFTNSGSEANEVAIRMARAHTGRFGVVAIDGAYHGHSSALIDISAYKFAGPGGEGRKSHVHLTAAPDPYRGEHSGYSEQSALAYAEELGGIISAAKKTGELPAFFICESLQGVGGQIIPPKAYLRHAFSIARQQGLVCIADEVQVGLGRIGTHMWAFESQEAIPDIVTIGKPIGNGHPISAVVTSPEIAASFANGMEYFNTFGGNPVSCAAAMAVLDVIQQEELQMQALETGEYLQSQLLELASRHELIGDVRGLGLFMGIDLVLDRDSKAPATKEAAFVVDTLRHQGILLSTEGPNNCVLKIKPPLVFTRTHADDFLAALDPALTMAATLART